MATQNKDFKVKNGLIVGNSTNLVNYTSSSPSNPFVGQLWIDSDESFPISEPDSYLSLTAASALYLPISASIDFLQSSTASTVYLKQDTASALYISNTIINSKGDLIVGSAADTPSILNAGNNGSVLTASSSDSVGMKWMVPPGTELGYATTSTNQTLTGTNSTLLSLTINAPGTPIIVTVGFSLYSYSYTTGNYTDCIFDLYSSTNTSLAVPMGVALSNIGTYGFDQISIEQTTPIFLQTRIQPSSGSITLQLRGRNLGSGDADFYRSGNPPAWIRAVTA